MLALPKPRHRQERTLWRRIAVEAFAALVDFRLR
jgi:hypothetical protein